MNDRHFHIKLAATYSSNDNLIDDLSITQLIDNKWEAIELDNRSGGFMLYINGLLSCQHLYLRTNAAERDIVLSSLAGEMQIVAGEFWDIKTIDLHFEAKIKSGTASDNDMNYIVDRMTHCPVSSNLPKHIHPNNSVIFK